MSQKMKRLLTKALLGFIVSFLFLTDSSIDPNNLVSAEGTSVDDETVFMNRLNNLYELNADKPEAAVAAMKALYEFGNEYPNSRFADDGQYLFLTAVFMGDITSRNEIGSGQNAERLIQRMDQLVNRYPGGKLEDSVILNVEEKGAQDSSYLLHIPYSCVVSYMQGALAHERRDYGRAAQLYSDLKDKIDYSKDRTHNLELLIYFAIVSSYDGIGKKEQADAILKEAVNRFPDNIRFKNVLERRSHGS